VGSSVVDVGPRLAVALLALTALATVLLALLVVVGSLRPAAPSPDELAPRRGEVEAALALGLPRRDAVLLIAPQLLVLVVLRAAEVLAVWTVTELVARGMLLDDVPR